MSAEPKSLTSPSSISLSGPGRLKGSFQPPGDKSISHRAVMLGALSQGKSRYSHFLEAEDCLHTLQAFREMGVAIDLKRGEGEITIQGAGLSALKKPGREIYLGNSGTSMRLLLGILAGQRFEAALTGDPSLSARPMKRVTEPLKQMGAQIQGRDHGNFAPLTIRGGPLKGIDFENKLASAQVKSALLFAGLYAEGKTRILERIPSRDHTERLLKAAGAKLGREGEWLVIQKAESLKPLEVSIPGDISSAAFFMVGAGMTGGSELRIQNVGLNPTRTGVLEVLKQMGAALEVKITRKEPEPVGEILIQGARLKGTRIRRDQIPSLIDELPILMTAMALAEGESLISGADELRLKETDRIHSMVTSLKAVGADIEELPDGCLIKGVEGFRGGRVQSYGDHRTAMSLALASLATQGEVTIEDTACVATSFPTFFADLSRLKK